MLYIFINKSRNKINFYRKIKSVTSEDQHVVVLQVQVETHVFWCENKLFQYAVRAGVALGELGLALAVGWQVTRHEGN